jgi:hypothetical protein
MAGRVGTTLLKGNCSAWAALARRIAAEVSEKSFMNAFMLILQIVVHFDLSFYRAGHGWQSVRKTSGEALDRLNGIRA